MQLELLDGAEVVNVNERLQGAYALQIRPNKTLTRVLSLNTHLLITYLLYLAGLSESEFRDNCKYASEQGLSV